jgi:uncharacterized YigZ family protein
VTSSEEAKERLRELAARYSDASHHCWAWRLGSAAEERSSDAGEPAGTAGLPILQVLRGAELSDVLAVVVRWFGGVKLGKGGLARAYAAAARLAVERLSVVDRIPSETLTLELAYPQVGAVKRLLRPPEVELLEERYEEAVTMILAVQCPSLERLVESLADLALVPKIEESVAKDRPTS